jgi:hypothetical protein
MGVPIQPAAPAGKEESHSAPAAGGRSGSEPEFGFAYVTLVDPEFDYYLTEEEYPWPARIPARKSTAASF